MAEPWGKPLTRQQPLTEQRLGTDKNERVFHYTYRDNTFFLACSGTISQLFTYLNHSH